MSNGGKGTRPPHNSAIHPSMRVVLKWLSYGFLCSGSDCNTEQRRKLICRPAQRRAQELSRRLAACVNATRFRGPWSHRCCLGGCTALSPAAGADTGAAGEAGGGQPVARAAADGEAGGSLHKITPLWEP